MRCETTPALAIALLAVLPLAHGSAAGEPEPMEAKMTGKEKVARGTFDVEFAADREEAIEASRIGRSTFEKQYRGDLRASASGTMLTLRTPVEGSAAYVAVERVRGELDGRAGTFALQHMGTMARGAEDLTIRVVPDSGTGDLEGLEGRLDIEIVEGEHRYALEYRIPDDEARR